MGVQDGFPVSAAYTNPRFISKNISDVMPFPLGFTGSGAAIADIQAAVNKLYTATGVSEIATGTVYNATPGTVSNGQTYEDCITVLADKFDASTGHMHTGASGDGPVLDVVLTAAVSGTGGTAIFGNITFEGGTGVTINQFGTNFVFNAAVATPTTIAASGFSALTGDVVLVPGTGGISITQSGHDITFNAAPSTTVAASGFSPLSGDVTLVAGSGGITITQSGQNITFEAGGGSVPIEFGSNDTSNLLQNQILTTTGAVLASNGPKNYIGNSSFQNNATTGWSLGTVTLTSNLPTGVPTFGSGASGNLSLSSTSSGPLSGTYSLSLASSAATTAGNFVASDAITLDTEDQAKVLSFKFFYSPTVGPTTANWSGTASNSFGVAIYDITNSAWIIPAGVFNLVQNAGVGIAQGTFQTPSNMTSYRIVLYNANATTGAITLLLDDMYCGPQALAFGPPISDWTSFTPTGSWTTNVTYTGYWRRVGDTMQVVAKVTCSGAPDATSLTFTIPFGLSIDTNKVVETATRDATYGLAQMNDFNVQQYEGFVRYNSTTSVAVMQGGVASSLLITSGPVNQTGPFTFGNQDFVTVNFSVPIVGWSSNTVMSQDTDTRVIAMQAVGNPPTGGTANGIIVFPTTNWDTSGSYNSSTGRYTAPVTGYYKISGFINASTSSNINVYVNGSGGIALGAISSGGTGSFTGTVQLNAGDLIDVRPTSNLSAGWGNGSVLSIERVSGPAVIAASETVSMSYTSTSSASAGTGTPVIYETKVYDDHDAFSGNTTFTAPIAGKYHVTASFYTGTNPTIRLYKNGSFVYQGTAATSSSIAVISKDIQLLPGDTLDIRPDGTVTMSNTAVIAYFDIYRFGN